MGDSMGGCSSGSMDGYTSDSRGDSMGGCSSVSMGGSLGGCSSDRA